MIAFGSSEFICSAMFIGGLLRFLKDAAFLTAELVAVTFKAEPPASLSGIGELRPENYICRISAIESLSFESKFEIWLFNSPDSFESRLWHASAICFLPSRI